MSLESLRRYNYKTKERTAFHHRIGCYMGTDCGCIAVGYPHDDKKHFGFSLLRPMLPISWIVGKKLGVDIFSKQNPLASSAFLFTMNQVLYLLIVMWIFNAVPDKMLMVYAMVLKLLSHCLIAVRQKSNGYKIFAIAIPLYRLYWEIFSADLQTLRFAFSKYCL